jgi:hypothetical protein
MRSIFNKTSFIAFFLLLINPVHSQTGPPYCNNLVTLEGKNFMCGGELFYPIVVEYVFTVIHNTSPPNSATDYYLSRARNYGVSFDFESTNASDCRTEIKNDLTIIHQMGFNCIRTAGFWPVFDVIQFEEGWKKSGFQEQGSFANTDFVQVCEKNTPWPWVGYGYKIPTGNSDPGNYRSHYFDMVQEILEIANECSLKVILDVGAGKLTVPANVISYKDYLSHLGIFINSLSNDLKNTLMAYSTVEEPYYGPSGPAPDFTKEIICDVTEQFYSTLKNTDPDHLITIGPILDYDIMLWDPGVMSFDFISPHVYPFPILGNTTPLFEVNADMAVERVKSLIYWWKNICPYPWIIGEIGFMANGIDHYPTTPASAVNVWGELEIPIAGELYTQRNFASTLLKWVRDCGGSGFSWWEFQDVSWATFGLLKKGGEAFTSFSSLRKPVVSEFENYFDLNGQPPPAIPADAIRPSLYYDMSNHAHFNPNTNYRNGHVKDADTQEPIKDAYISATNLIHDYPGEGLIPDEDRYHSYQTFTHQDGSFTTIPYDYWDNGTFPPHDRLTDLWITASGSNRIERGGNYWGINSGPIVDNDIYLLKRNSDKQISNFTLTAGNSSSYKSFNTLTIKNVIIEATASADFLARNEINILNDFDAISGSEVLIHLGDVFPDCNDYTSYARLRNNYQTELDIQDKTGSKEIILNFINKEFYTISPNPNNGIFEIKFKSIPNSLNKIKVFNVFGELNYSVEVYDKEVQLNLNNLSKGVYFTVIENENISLVKKIIIQ